MKRVFLILTHRETCKLGSKSSYELKKSFHVLISLNPAKQMSCNNSHQVNEIVILVYHTPDDLNVTLHRAAAN